jgi:peroxiredoxin
VPCRAHLGEVSGRYGDIREAGGDVLVISFTGPEKVRAYLERYPQLFPVVSDPERTAYRAFSLERTSWASFLRLGVIARYLKLILLGWLPRKTGKGEDVLQLGGDFVIDRAGRLAYAYRSEVPTDRPPARALLEAVRAAVTPGSAASSSRAS